jgi:hypothetical protein
VNKSLDNKEEYTRAKERKSHKRGQGQLKNMAKQKGNRVN